MSLPTSTDLDTMRAEAGGLAILNPRTGRDRREDHIDALATISAGYRLGEGRESRPQASRDGTIYLHDPDGRAPGLAAALKAGGGKRLGVAFLADDPERIVRQLFMSYSASRLIAYGDERRITWIRWNDDGDAKKGFAHVTFERGSDEYERARAKCKTYAAVYFALARYDDEGQPEVVFPDGYGYYRLRTTSLNSLRTLKSNLDGVRRLTGGRLRGIPFELTIGYQEVAGPDGTKRKIPVWRATLKPPGGLVLGSRTFAALARAGLEQGRMLALPPASDELLEAEATGYLEAEAVEMAEPTDAETDLVARGGRCDAAYWTTRWHATAKGSRYEDDEQRHRLIYAVTRGRYAGLRDFLAEATEAEASQLVMTLEQAKAMDAAPPEGAEPKVIPVRYPERDEDPYFVDGVDIREPEDDEPDGEAVAQAAWERGEEETEPDPEPPSDDEMLAGMARKAVHAFLEAFRKEDGERASSVGLRRAWAKFVGELPMGEAAFLAVLPRLVGKADPLELTAAELRAVMSWGGGPDAPDHIAAMQRLGAPTTASMP